MWWLSVAVGALAAALTAPASAARTTNPTATRRACQQHTLNATLHTLHTSPARWHIQPINPANLAYTSPTAPHDVYIATDAPCHLVGDIVRHEWMHTQQYQHPELTYPGRDVEIEADCGAWLLGSTVLPYVDQARRSGGVGCTLTVLEYAEVLIRDAGAAEVRSIWH